MDTINRKDFFRKICISGACMCGFGAVALAAGNKNTEHATEAGDNNLELIQSWISHLLLNVNENLGEDEKRKILKSCSITHYENLKMDEILSPYKGNLDTFIGFLEEKWGWKVDYNKTTKTLIANENKNYCVCPVINNKNISDKSAICYCSEGFAEKMFSEVAEIPATATVISSVHRGGENCIYKVVFNDL